MIIASTAIKGGMPEDLRRSDIRCSIDRGQHDSSDYDCGSPVGTVGEGAQVNFQLGVAWRRYTGSDPGFGLTPPFVSAINLNDRANTGGSQFIPVSPGQCVQHTYQTSSYGLPETFPPWNTACQDRTCSYALRHISTTCAPSCTS